MKILPLLPLWSHGKHFGRFLFLKPSFCDTGGFLIVQLLDGSCGYRGRNIPCVSRVLSVEYVIAICAFAFAFCERTVMRELEKEEHKGKKIH